MTTRNTQRAGTGGVARLTPLIPDAGRAEIVRLRCRAELARRAERARRADAFVASVTRVFVPVALGAFSALYAAAFLSATLRVERWLR